MKKYAYIGCLGFLGIITTEFGVIGFLPQLAKHYHISIDKAGTLLSAFSLVIALTGPFMTLLASSFDRKKVMFTAILIFLISNIISVFNPPFWLLMVARVLPAFLQPVYIATALSVAVAMGDKDKENEMMSIVFSGVALAMVTTVPFATYMASVISFESAYVIQGLVLLIGLGFIYFGLPPIPVQGKKSYGSQVKILTQPAFIYSTLMNFFMISGWFSTYSYFAEYLNKAKEMNETMVSSMLLVFGVIGVIASILAGKLLNKHIAGTTAFFLSGTLIIPVLLYYSGGNTIATIFVIGLWGFLYSPSFLNASTYMISSAPHAMEFANSMATSTGNLGVTLGTTAGGWMIATHGVVFTPWLTLGFGVAAYLMMLCRGFR